MTKTRPLGADHLIIFSGLKLGSLLPSAVLILILLFSSACGVKHRIEKNSEYFENLKKSDQELIAQQKIKQGFTTDMVAIAWGRPSEKFTKTSSDNKTETWVYGQSGTDYQYHKLRVYDRTKRRYHQQIVRVPYHYFYFGRYVVFENGVATEFERVGRKYSQYHSWRSLYNNPCRQFGFRSSMACRQFNSILKTNILDDPKFLQKPTASSQ